MYSLFGIPLHLTTAMLILTIEAMAGYIAYHIWERRQRGKVWAVEINTNTGQGDIRKVLPTDEGYTIGTGKNERFVKLEDQFAYPTPSGRPMFIVDADNAYIDYLIPKGVPGAIESYEIKADPTLSDRLGKPVKGRITVENALVRLKGSEFAGLEGRVLAQYAKGGSIERVASAADGDKTDWAKIAVILGGVAIVGLAIIGYVLTKLYQANQG